MEPIVPLKEEKVYSEIIIIFYKTSPANYNLCINSPLRSFGSNQVDFGGINLFSSAIFIRSSIDVGYMTKATPPVLSAISANSAALWLPPTKEILWSVRGSAIPRTGLRT